MIFIQKDEIVIRELTEKDAYLLVNWLSNPDVLKYYEGRDRPQNYQLIHKHYYEDRENITQCIIEYNEKEIGYIQFYSITDEERIEYGYENIKEPIYGMDQFIGEIEYWNKGIGTRLINFVIEYLINKGINIIVMDPQAWNHRAIRTYEKCGFIKKKFLPKHEYHEGEMKDCWLMELRSY